MLYFIEHLVTTGKRRLGKEGKRRQAEAEKKGEDCKTNYEPVSASLMWVSRKSHLPLTHLMYTHSKR